MRNIMRNNIRNNIKNFINQLTAFLYKKAFWRQVLIIVLISTLIFPLGACGLNSKARRYIVYYRNMASTKLIETNYDTKTTDKETLVKELIARLGTKSKENEIVQLIPDNLSVTNVEIDGNRVLIYFDSKYQSLKNSDELLLRAGLIKTLSQIDDVKYFSFYVDGEDAKYKDGSLIGLQSEEDFVDENSDSIPTVKFRDVNLYFANQSGDALVKKTETVAYSKQTPIEKVIVEQLIRGPVDNSMNATLPLDVKLLSITVSNGVCYVNLSSNFLTEMVNVSNDIPVFSIVNSLTSLSNIDSVKILVNGQSAKFYKETINLDVNFKYNEEIVDNKRGE